MPPAASTGRSGRSSPRGSRTRSRCSSPSSRPTRRTTPTSSACWPPRRRSASRRFRGTVRSPRCASARSRATGSSTRPSSSLSFPTLDLFVTGSADSIVMVEGGAHEISEKDVLERPQDRAEGDQGAGRARQEDHRQGGQAEDGVEEGRAGRGPHQACHRAAREADGQGDQREGQGRARRGRRRGQVGRHRDAGRRVPRRRPDIGNEIEEVEYRVMRAQVLDKGERVDGRDIDTVRPITHREPACCPRAHGSALFTRGQTQALVAVTLGTADDEQRIDTIDVPRETTKSFMLHYNFPPYCTGEVKIDPRHQPPRNRPRHARRAGPAGAAPARTRSSPTRCASSRKSSSRTARRRWRPSAAARSR